jgi:hypothetical protein
MICGRTTLIAEFRVFRAHSTQGNSPSPRRSRSATTRYPEYLNVGSYYGNSGIELLGSRMGLAAPLAFYDIPDAEQVYRRVNEARTAQQH